jgi:hypothetical protein
MFLSGAALVTATVVAVHALHFCDRHSGSS